MEYKFAYSAEKDLILKESRKVSFKDIIDIIKTGGLLDDVDHFNKEKYPNQRIFIVKLKNKLYAVPYVKDEIKKVIFLKTFYPNRKLKKIYNK